MTTFELDGAELVSTTQVGEGEREQFQRDGFVRLRQIFSPTTVAALREVAKEKLREQAAAYGPEAMRIGYRLHDTPTIQTILRNDGMARLLTGLTGSRLIPTETQAFELTADRGSVPWHFGYISYGYIRARDMAHTLWIPLTDIDATTNGGGMAYVPEHVISARHGYDLGTTLAPRILEGDPPTELLEALDAAHEAMKPIFEEHKVEDSFDVGDALLFNKNVWHRSSPWRGEGAPRRVGVAMRFVVESARVDRVRWTAEYNFGGGIGTGQSRPVMAGNEDRFSRFADIEDGELISTSEACTFIL